MKAVFLFVFLIFLAPAVSAFDCNSLPSDQLEECQALNELNEDFIAGLIYTNTSYPDHPFIHDYNSQISVNNAPQDAEKKSKRAIKDAWFSILTAMPSILYENKNPDKEIPRT